MHYGIIFSIFIYFSTSLFGQKYDQNWLIGYDEPNVIFNNYLDFSKSPVEAISRESKLKFALSLNVTFSDFDGNFLFYSDGCRIFDSENNLVINGDNINAGPVADAFYNEGYPINQGAIVIPTPGVKNEFEYLTLLIESVPMYGGHPVKLLNHHIKLDQNNKLLVTSKNVTILQDTFSNSDLVACKHGNGEDWWIFLPKIQSNGYYSLLLDKNGFHNKGIQHIGPLYDYSTDWSGQSVFSPDGTKYARYDRGNELAIFDFDRNSGLLSNPVHMNIIDSADSLYIACGLSFSPNSRYLYAASTLSIYQFDMQASSILDSKLTVAEYDGFQDPFASCFYLMQLAPNNKIYICSAYNNHYLHSIENPDLGGLACNVKQHSLQLPHNLIAAMPYFPNYRLGKSMVNVNDTLSNINNSVELYPNPVIDKFSVNIKSNDLLDLEIVIFNPLGQKILTHKIVGSEEIDLSHFPTSWYLYNILKNGSVIKKGKVIKL